MSRPDRPRIAPDPVALRPDPWADYDLVDSGGGRKLERFGPVKLVRPEPQCLWAPAQPDAWEDAEAVFDGPDDEDAGQWRRAGPAPDAWTLRWRAVTFEARLTSFRHVGLFPEQASNWAWLDERLRARGEAPRVLNLFGYTGVASLVAAAAGARVTHLDASRKSVAWARRNADVAGLQDAPVRWICDDARTYAGREVRRGSAYEGIILDPPKYGRGPGGEVWRLYDDLPPLLDLCVALLSPEADFLLLNAYSERLSALALAHLLAQKLADRGGRIDWGELTLNTPGGPGVGLSVFARWSRA